MARVTKTRDKATSPEVAPAVPLAVPPEPVAESHAPSHLPAAVVSPATAPAPARVPSGWRVAKTAKVSLQGQMTTLPEGTIVSESSYGPGIIERLREQKVALEPID